MKKIDAGHYEGTQSGHTITVISLVAASDGTSKERGWIYAVDGQSIDVAYSKADAERRARFAAING